METSETGITSEMVVLFVSGQIKNKHQHEKIAWAIENESWAKKIHDRLNGDLEDIYDCPDGDLDDVTLSAGMVDDLEFLFAEPPQLARQKVVIWDRIVELKKNESNEVTVIDLPVVFPDIALDPVVQSGARFSNDQTGGDGPDEEIAETLEVHFEHVQEVSECCGFARNVVSEEFYGPVLFDVEWRDGIVSGSFDLAQLVPKSECGLSVREFLSENHVVLDLTADQQVMDAARTIMRH